MPQPLAAAGKVHAIAVSGPARLEGLPDIPTFAERGLPGVDLCQLDGPGRPGGNAGAADRAIELRVRPRAGHGAGEGVVPQPGRHPAGRHAADFARRIEADYRRWGDVIRAAGIKAE